MTAQHPYKTSMGAVFCARKNFFETLEYCKGIARFGVLIYDRSKRKTQTTKKSEKEK
jgi:hypothetical protein